ncbi:MAG: hypothetical protein MJA83_11410 [Gammaproteobacteria bacterium]|nr:hypothetical protein [Gammaproteobacteria bacterium]
MKKRAYYYVLAVLLFSTPAAHAVEEEDAYRWSIDVRRYETDLLFDDGSLAESRFTSAGAEVWEEFGPHFRGALTAAYFDLSQPDNTFQDGLDPTGFFLGVKMEWGFLPEKAVDFVFQAGVDYFRLDDSDDGQDIEFEGFTGELRLGPLFRIRGVELSAGGYYQEFDGDESLRGPVDQTRDFEPNEHTGVYFGLRFPLDAGGGNFAFEVIGGAREGWMLSFARSF